MNAELVRAACRAFNAHNADECLAHIAPDFITNLAELPEPTHGQEAWRQNFETMKHVFLRCFSRTSSWNAGSASPEKASSIAKHR